MNKMANFKRFNISSKTLNSLPLQEHRTVI